MASHTRRNSDKKRSNWIQYKAPPLCCQIWEQQELDSGLAYKIKNIGTGENEMNILNDLATWGERCISEDRTVANVNRQHYDRIYAGLCENMENLYAKPSL